MSSSNKFPILCSRTPCVLGRYAINDQVVFNPSLTFLNLLLMQGLQAQKEMRICSRLRSSCAYILDNILVPLFFSTGITTPDKYNAKQLPLRVVLKKPLGTGLSLLSKFWVRCQKKRQALRIEIFQGAARGVK